MLQNWISAFRLRTLPLALSCIGMGSLLAAYFNAFSWTVCLLSLATTLFLQILSNLANDYGDSIHGADSLDRQGPKRAVQQGVISKESMKKAIILFSLLSFSSGLALLYASLELGSVKFYSFLALGLLAIIAAIAYTNGKKPYGYMGLGDVFVFLFFGIIGVGGTFWLHSDRIYWQIMLPAIACGLFATAVLNVNNIRDIESDSLAGKRSIPVRLGARKAKLYHSMLIGFAWLATICFYFFIEFTLCQLLVFLSLPFFIFHLKVLYQSSTPQMIDPLLKQLALSTLFYVICFGLSILLCL